MNARLCTVDGCGERHHAHGRCRRHYQQWRRTTQSWADQRAALIENIEHLLGYDTAAHIAARLGYDKPRSLARRLSRAGRHDLARQFRRTPRPRPAVLEGSMNTTPTATVPNKYRNDLTAGACYGQPNFTEQPLAAQYVACLGCHQESRRRKPGRRPPGRPRKVREVAP